eukprot:gene10690-11827_t
MSVPYTISTILLGIIAYFIRSWKILLITCTAPYIPVLISFRFIPESIRWHNVHGQTDNAMKTVKRIAKFNRKVFPFNLKLAEVEKPEEKSTRSILNLFRPMKMAISTLIQSFAWAVSGMVFYGMAFAAADLGGSMYRDFILISFIEIPADAVGIYLTQRIGRKKTTLILAFIGGVACIAIAAIPTDKHPKLTALRVCIGVFSKFCFAISYNALHLWSVELYPIVIRGMALGYLQAAACLGSLLAPWVANWLIEVHPALPFSLFGACAVISAALELKLPETACEATAVTPESANECLVPKKWVTLL